MYRVEVSIYGPVEDLCIGLDYLEHMVRNGTLCDEVDAPSVGPVHADVQLAA